MENQVESNLPEVITKEIKHSGIEDMNLAERIASNFVPFLTEITEETDKLKGLKLGDPEDAEIAKRVNINLGHIRGRKNKTKADQKAFYQPVIKFIDSLANLNEGMIVLGQSDAQEFSKYFERQEAERVAKLKVERWEKLSEYLEVEPPGLDIMTEEVFGYTLMGAKANYEARIKAEKEAEEARLEGERLEKEQEVRRAKRAEELRPYYSFMSEDEISAYDRIKDEGYSELLDSLKKKKSDHEAEQERIRIENERLKKEAEKKAEADKRQKAAEEERKLKEKRRNDAGIARQEILSEIGVKLDFNSCADMEESVWIAFFEEKNKEYQKEQNRIFLHKEKEKKEQAEKQAELDRVQKELQAEKDRQAKIEADAKAKKEAEEKAAKELAMSGDKNRMKVWVENMEIEGIDKQGLSEESNTIVMDIFTKFTSFKNWATKEIEKL